MKRLIIFALLPLFLFIITGCSNNGGGSGTTDPFGIGNTGGGNNGGGNNNGNVTIEVGLAQDNQGTLWFGFNPNVAITITSVVVSQADLGVNETITNPNPTQQFEPVQAGNYYTFYQPQQQLQAGQQWSFQFSGTIVQGGNTYNKTVNYTIQGN